MARPLTLDLLASIYSVGRIPRDSALPPARPGALRILIDDPRESTLICPAADMPPTVQQVQPGWRALMIVEDTDFDEPGILVSITSPIAQAGIGLLGHSTFTADCVFVAAPDLDAAILALRQAGHTVRTMQEPP